MTDPKTTPVYGQFIQDGDRALTVNGLSQYAYVAALFHAELTRDFFQSEADSAATKAFVHADAFFAELAKRTQS